MKSQNTLILNHLQKGKYITAMNASYLFDCWRCASRIYELREAGYNIKTELVTTITGKVYARYSLTK